MDRFSLNLSGCAVENCEIRSNGGAAKTDEALRRHLRIEERRQMEAMGVVVEASDGRVPNRAVHTRLAWVEGWLKVVKRCSMPAETQANLKA